MIGEDVVFQQRIGEVMFLDESRERPQVLSVGAKSVMADAAFIAARIDEGGVIEMGHGGLLLRCLPSPSQLWNWSKSGPLRR